MQRLPVPKLQYRLSNSPQKMEPKRQKEAVKVTNSKIQTVPEHRRVLIKGSNSKIQTEPMRKKAVVKGSDSKDKTEPERQKAVVNGSNSKIETDPKRRKVAVKISNSKIETYLKRQKVVVKISNLKIETYPNHQKVVFKGSNSKMETDPKRQKVVFKASNLKNKTEPEKVAVKGANSNKQTDPECQKVAVKGSNSKNQTDTEREKVLQDLEDFRKNYMKATGSRRDMAALNSTKGLSLTSKDTDDLGPIPGVRVGDTFKYRAELTLLGLHKHLRAGVSFKKPDNTPPYSKTKDVVTSVVATERVDKMEPDNNTLIYTGLGGINRKPSRLKNGKKIHHKDQTLDGANLALLNSINRDPVRVMYGREVENKDTKEKGMIYTFYGMFYVTDKIEKEVVVKEEGDEKSHRVNYDFKLERVNRDEVVEETTVSRVLEL